MFIIFLAKKNEFYNQFFTSSTADDQLEKLKTILSYNKTDLDQDFIEFLTIVFLQAPVKHPVKCFLTRYAIYNIYALVFYNKTPTISLAKYLQQFQ